MQCINADIAASTKNFLRKSLWPRWKPLQKSLWRGVGFKRQSVMPLGRNGSTELSRQQPVFRSHVLQNIRRPGCDDGSLAIGAATYLYHSVWFVAVSPSNRGRGGRPGRAHHIPTDRGGTPSRRRFDRLYPMRRRRGCRRHRPRGRQGDRLVRRTQRNRPLRPWDTVPYNAATWLKANWPRVQHAQGPRRLASLRAGGARGACRPMVLRLARSPPCALHRHPPLDGRAESPTPTARRILQTVDPSCGEFFRVVRKFFEKTGVPLVLNTSFNGPGQPIVESPQDAIDFLRNSTLDALYMGGYCVTRS